MTEMIFIPGYALLTALNNAMIRFRKKLITKQRIYKNQFKSLSEKFCCSLASPLDNFGILSFSQTPGVCRLKICNILLSTGQLDVGYINELSSFCN